MLYFISNIVINFLYAEGEFRSPNEWIQHLLSEVLQRVLLPRGCWATVVSKAGRVLVFGNLESHGRHGKSIAAWCGEQNGRRRGSRVHRAWTPDQTQRFRKKTLHKR